MLIRLALTVLFLGAALSTKPGLAQGVLPEPTSPIVISSGDGLTAIKYMLLSEPPSGGESNNRKLIPTFSTVVVRADLRKWELKLLVPSKTSRPTDNYFSGLPLSEYAQLTKAKSVMSGGYLSSYSPALPLGLVMKAGKAISKPHHSWLTNAVICIDENKKVSIEYSSAELPSGKDSDCLEAGPMLVYDGEVVFTSEQADSAVAKRLMRSNQEQAVVCLANDGQVILAVSEPVKLQLFEEFLVPGPQHGGLGCRRAIRLSGSTTAGLYVDGKLQVGNGDVLLPDALSLSYRNNKAH